MATNDNNKLKVFKWSRNPTLLLLSLVKENYHQLEIGVKKLVFQQIANEMNEQLGTNLAYDQLESKWHAIKRTYRKVSASKTGFSWEYYDKVDEIFKDNIEFMPTTPVAISKTDLTDDDDNALDGPECSFKRQRTSKRRRSSGDTNDYVISYEFEAQGDCNYDHKKSNAKVLRRKNSADERSVCEAPSSDVNRQLYLDIEAARERRHQEKMKMARKFLAIFEKLVEKM